MYKCKMKSYEGDQPYIFVSYAHKDSDLVLPILDRLSAHGFRVWYDDGIEPGSEWPEYIATHLAGSSVVLAMISDNSIASSNCRRELTYAMSKNKPFLGVLLEETQMSAGMEMQLSAHQCVLRYQFRDPKTGAVDDDLFAEKLCRAEMLQPCREKHPEAAPAAKAVPPPAVDPAPVPSPAAKAPKEPTPEPKKRKPDATAKGRKKKAALLGLAAGVLVLAVVLLFVLLGGSVQITPKTALDSGAASATFRNEEIDAAAISKLGQLDSLRYLYFYSCTFADASPTDLSTLGQLATLKVENCSGISAFDFSRASMLTTLTVTGSNLTNAGLQTLNAPKLKELSISGNADCSDLSILPDTIVLLNVSFTGVTDLSVVSRLPKLAELSVDFCKIDDAEPIALCQSLREFTARSCGIRGWQNRFASLSLESLVLDGNPLSDATCFDDLTRLKELSLNDTNIQQIACIAKSAGTLESLGLNHTQISSYTLNEDAASCTGLKYLQIAGIKVSSLDFLENMSNLVYLDAEGCGLVDIDALSGTPLLQTAYLGNNDLSDASALSALTGNGIRLDLRNNHLSQLALPASVDTLLLYGNPIEALSAITPSVSVRTLVFSFDESIFSAEYAALCDRARVTYPYVLDAPADRALDTQDRLGKVYTTLLTTEQFEAAYLRNRYLDQVSSLDFE